MAEIRDDLVLDIDQALRQIDQIERSLDTALQPIEVKVDPVTAQRQLDELARAADQALSDVDLDIDSTGAQRLNSELATAERHLADADEEAARLERNLKDAAQAFNGVDTTARNTTSSFGTLERSAGNIRNALVAIGGAAIFAGALRGANAAIQSFAVLEDSINAVNVIFDSAGDSVLKFGEDAARSAGLSEAAFNQAVTPIGALLQNFGFDAREAGDAAVILVQRAADLASVLGGDVTTALEAISSALRGQSEPLTAYGATISAARVEQFALANGLAATKAEITDAITLQARYGLILEDTSAVAGDYAATADDLANAQRTAAAEAANFGTDIGEVLAPALEVIVGLIPEVLEGLRQLVPGFAAAADSAATFLEEAATTGGDGGSGFREFFATLRAGAGDIGEIIPGLGDLATVIGTAVVGNADAADRALARLDTRLARSQLRTIGTQLAQSLDVGTDATDAFTTALGKLGAESDVIDVFKQGYRDFAIQANLTDVELQNSTRDLLLNAEALHLGADEIDFLRRVLNELNEELDDGGRANADYLASIAAIGDGFGTVTTRFTTFAGDVETSSDRASIALAELAAAAEAQQARTAAAFNLFEDLPEQISGSFSRAVDTLRTQVESIADFEINLAILDALNLDALEEDFRAKGIGFAGQLEEAVNDIPKAIEADQLLQGMGVLGEDMFAALVDKFISLGLTPADAREIAGKFATPQVIAASEEASKSVAAAQAGTYHETLTEEMDQLIPEVGDQIGRSIETHWRLEDEADSAASGAANSFLQGVADRVTPDALESALNLFGLSIDGTDVGIEYGQTLIGGVVIGVTSSTSVNRLRDAVVDATNNALEARSPSRVMLDLGESAGDAFWQGFNQADLTLRTAVPSITGSIAQGAVAGVAAGVNVNINLDHASLQDPVSDVARMAQIAGSVAQTFNAVR